MNAMAPQIAVLGAGSWGTALAILLSRNGADVKLWGLPNEVDALIKDGENKRFLPGVPFPDGLQPTADLRTAVSTADEVLVVVPSHVFPAVLNEIEPLLQPATTLSCTMCFWA